MNKTHRFTVRVTFTVNAVSRAEAKRLLRRRLRLDAKDREWGVSAKGTWKVTQGNAEIE